jgi:hypothetical protein
MVKYQGPREEKEVPSEKTTKPVIEPYPKADWMEIRADPELNNVVGIESYEKAMLILLWRILKKLDK